MGKPQDNGSTGKYRKVEESGREGEGPTGRLPEAGLKSRPLSCSHPLQSKMLLVTLRWQAVTHKL